MATLNINIQAMAKWPGNSTNERKNSPFVHKGRMIDFEDTWRLLHTELRHVGAREVTLFTMHSKEDIRVDGRLRADTRTPSHPGVILQFDKYAGYDEAAKQSNFVQLRFPCDTFNGWKTNVRAIALALEALRKVDRYGVTTGAQYAGYKALPAGDVDLTPELAADFIARSAGMGSVPGIAASIIANTGGFGDIVYKTAAKLLHPDKGGNPEDFKRLEKARRIVDAVQQEKSAGEKIVMATAAQKKAKEMYEHLSEARHEYNELCKKAFPVGTEVCYAHGDTLRFGVVEDVGYGHRLKIRGVGGTGYWIDTYRILDELEVE